MRFRVPSFFPSRANANVAPPRNRYSNRYTQLARLENKIVKFRDLTSHVRARDEDASIKSNRVPIFDIQLDLARAMFFFPPIFQRIFLPQELFRLGHV